MLLSLGAIAVGIGILLDAAAPWLLNRLQTSAFAAPAEVAFEGVRRWARPVGWALIGGGVGLLLTGLAWRLLRRRRRQLRARILAVSSGACRVPVSQLSLRRARWAPRHAGLLRARLRYRPVDAVVSDCSAALAEALEPHTGRSMAVRWQPRRSRFLLVERPALAMRVEQQHLELGKLADTLGHIIGAVTVDQQRSTVTADGAVQQLIARYAHTTRDIGDGFRQRVQAVLDAKAPSPSGYWTVRWNPAGNEVTVVPADPLPRSAPYPLTDPQGHDQLVVPLGLGDGGEVVSWRPEVFPHLLVVGPTGTGKTIFLNNLIVSCLARGWLVFLVDPKELSFRGFDPDALARREWPLWPGVETVATTEPAMESAIDTFYQHLRDRYAALKGFEVAEVELRPMLLVIDEAGELVERLGAYHVSDEKFVALQERAVAEGRDPSKVSKPRGTKNPELAKAWSTLRLGRQGRTFMVTATQRPDVSFIPGEARSNLTTRVGLGHLDGAALEMVFHTRAVQQRVFEIEVDPVTGARHRRRVRGRATVDVGDGPRTIQTYWVPDPAKVITGELAAHDVTLVHGLQQMVQRSRPRWNGQTNTPAVTARSRAAAASALADPAPQVAEPSPVVEDDIGEDLPTVAGEQLAIGQIAVLEVECRPTVVELEEIEDDPFEDDDLQVTYRTTSGDGSGELGVTSVGRKELVRVLES